MKWSSEVMEYINRKNREGATNISVAEGADLGSYPDIAVAEGADLGSYPDLTDRVCLSREYS